jgi:probable rRNA maturation factor
MELEVYNNQDAIRLKPRLLQKWQEKANLALPLALAHQAHDGGVLPTLDLIEVSIVDDKTIAEVHTEFMQILGATDVITFSHGEIVVSIETAITYAQDYGHGFEKELMLYIVHGLLHLSGHEDSLEEERLAMEAIQSKILNQIWD